jgi:hypothetical protein
MRILALLDSNVKGGKGNIPPEDLFPNAMQAPLSQAIGEEVITRAYPVWPTKDLPKAAERWINEFQPDLIVFAVGPFWFLYESTPVRMERRLRGPGRFINKRAQKIAATPWLAHNRPFQWLRRQTQRTVGGDTWFEPEHVIEVSQDVIRTLVRYESAYLVVFAPGNGARWAKDEEARLRLERRSEKVTKAIAAFCAEHHVDFFDTEATSRFMEARETRPPSSLQGDQLHLDREGHRRAAISLMTLTLEVIRRAKEHRDRA